MGEAINLVNKLKKDNYNLEFLNTKFMIMKMIVVVLFILNYNDYKFLFMGDADVVREKDILDKYNLSDIDILKIGYHGSNTSKELINEIKPNYSIISVGKNNRYGHPNKEVLDNLEDSKIYRIDQVGSIMFKIKNNKLKIETCSL